MNLENLRTNYPKLLSYMEEQDYSKCYISKLKSVIMHILNYTEKKGWKNYRDVYDEYTKKLKSKQNLRLKRTFLGILEHYDERGLLPDGHRKQQIVERGKYHLLNQEYKSMIDYYSATEKKRGKKDSTIRGESLNTACFLYELQESGYVLPDQITEEAVLSFFISPKGKLIRSYSYKKNIAAVIKACIPKNPEVFNRILAFLPPLRENRKNIQYLKPEEITSLKEAFSDTEASISLRDKAIGTLAFYTGLRSCDIAGLKISAIDWENDRLYITQQKTNVPLGLPLTTTVGNAIYDYLKSERPVNDLDYLFISYNRPYGRLQDRSVGNIATKIMNAANIRQAPGDRRGFHIFRHNLATTLLENDVPEPVILRLTGHTAPDSLEPYLSANFKRLKECALSIERYPMVQEVFGDA